VKRQKAGRYFRGRIRARKSIAPLGKRNLDIKPQSLLAFLAKMRHARHVHFWPGVRVYPRAHNTCCRWRQDQCADPRQAADQGSFRFCIDAPEKGQPFGQRAKAALSELMFGKDVKLRPHTIDRYGRLVARVLARHDRQTESTCARAATREGNSALVRS